VAKRSHISGFSLTPETVNKDSSVEREREKHQHIISWIFPSIFLKILVSTFIPEGTSKQANLFINNLFWLRDDSFYLLY
jgi:hypothetical protein